MVDFDCDHLFGAIGQDTDIAILHQEPERLRPRVSLWATLLLVGAAVWVAHWRPTPWAADRQSLSRRLYVWAALLASVLVMLGAGVGMLNALLQQIFSAHPRLADPSNLDFGHYLAVVVVAAAVGFYHWRILRADAAARPPKVSTHPAPEPVTAPVTSASVATATPARVTDVADLNARRYVLTVTDATEDDVHQALAKLPPQASYRLTPEEKDAVDGS